MDANHRQNPRYDEIFSLVYHDLLTTEYPPHAGSWNSDDKLREEGLSDTKSSECVLTS